jgi:hypothetical protein
LLLEPIGDELVVYDAERKEAHCLKGLGAFVFSNCDGETDPAVLAVLATAKLGEPIDTVHVEQVLVELDGLALMVRGPSARGISRRDMMRRSALVGASAFVVPVISTYVPPPSTHKSFVPCDKRACQQCCPKGDNCECECMGSGERAFTTTGGGGGSQVCVKRKCDNPGRSVTTGTCASRFCGSDGYCTPSS